MKELLKNISPWNHRTEMPTAQFVAKKILAFWFCYIVGLFIAEGIVILLHLAMGKNMFAGDMFEFQTMLLMKYYGYIVVIAVVLIYWKKAEKKQLSVLGLGKGVSSYLIGIVLSVFTLLVCVGVTVLTGNMEYHGIFAKVNLPVILLFMGGFVVQGAMEEVLCRGFLLHALREKVSLPIAVLISTIMFVLPHWSSLFAGEKIYGVIGILNLCLISLVFSLLTLRYKSIWAACGFHSYWNAILYSILGLNLSGNDENVTAILNMQSVGENIWNGAAYGIEASVITTVVLACCVLGLWFAKK